ncbi:hypothetical protein C8R44DRAFT_974291 [Mycena epipterygia]|nr:hypothetical protein C8R44DRAFT_974291 [Mycena epipterygia]
MSSYTSSMEALPHEMWLRIFALVDSSKSLGSVVLVCRKFHVLGTEALVRNVTWRSSTVALNHLQFWVRNPSKTHLVRSLSLSLNSRESHDADEEYLQIFGCIQSFSKLNHLRLSWGAIPDILYHTLQHLPCLTHLTLSSCSVPTPPPFFPLSFPSPSSESEPPLPIAITTLTVSKLKPFQFLLDAVTLPLAYFLPHLTAFTSDTLGIQIPAPTSATLTSFTLRLASATGDIQPRLAILLHRMPSLIHLDVSILPTGHHHPHGTASAVSPQPAAPLPHLRTLSASWPAAGHILQGAPALRHLRVASAIGKAADAIWLLERVQAGGVELRSAALRLAVWDDEVLLAAARCLPECEALEVAYQDGGPDDVCFLVIVPFPLPHPYPVLVSPSFSSLPHPYPHLVPLSSPAPRPCVPQTFLFNLGIHHLPLLRRLHTLRLVRVPRTVDTAPRRFVWSPVSGATATMNTNNATATTTMNNAPAVTAVPSFSSPSFISTSAPPASTSTLPMPIVPVSAPQQFYHPVPVPFASLRGRLVRTASTSATADGDAGVDLDAFSVPSFASTSSAPRHNARLYYPEPPDPYASTSASASTSFTASFASTSASASAPSFAPGSSTTPSFASTSSGPRGNARSFFPGVFDSLARRVEVVGRAWAPPASTTTPTQLYHPGPAHLPGLGDDDDTEDEDEDGGAGPQFHHPGPDPYAPAPASTRRSARAHLPVPGDDDATDEDEDEDRGTGWVPFPLPADDAEEDAAAWASLGLPADDADEDAPSFASTSSTTMPSFVSPSAVLDPYAYWSSLALPGDDADAFPLPGDDAEAFLLFTERQRALRERGMRMPLVSADHERELLASAAHERGIDEIRERQEREQAERDREDREKETTAALRECVHAWARYNPALKRVQLGVEGGRAWVKRGAGESSLTGTGKGTEADANKGIESYAGTGIESGIGANIRRRGNIANGKGKEKAEVWDVDWMDDEERAEEWAGMVRGEWDG